MADAKVAAIVAAADKQRDSLEGVARAIDTQINTIKDKEWDRPLTSAEQKKLGHCREQKSAVLSAIEELAYVTMGALDQTGELTRLANALAGIAKDLKARTDDINAVSAGATDIGAISDAISGLATNIAGLAGKNS